MGQNVSSLEYGNCRDPCVNADAVFIKVNKKSISRKKKSGSSSREISVSCGSKAYDVTTPYYLFFSLLSVKWSLTEG